MSNFFEETFEKKSARAKKIAEALLKMYSRRKTVLTFSNPWECLVAVQLSAQCTDKRVNIVTPALFAKYPRVEDYAIAGSTAEGVREFEEMIHSTGFYHNKARNILGAAVMVVEKFKGKVPKTMKELLTLPGVARKTANVILFNAFGLVEGVAVDTHVKRITNLLGLISSEAAKGGAKSGGAGAVRVSGGAGAGDPVKIEKELMKLLPRKHWALFSLLITEHGREICIARKPKCKECKLNKMCPGAII